MFEIELFDHLTACNVMFDVVLLVNVDLFNFVDLYF